MFSRRLFLLGSLSFLVSPQLALAAKKKPKLPPPKAGPHSLAKHAWPPALSPDHIAIVDKGNVMLSDQSGRLAIVDLRQEDGPHVIGELSGIGKKIIDMTTSGARTYALAFAEVGTESQYSLVVINTTPSSDPSIIQRFSLPLFSEPTSVTAANEALVVSGIGQNGDNLVVIYQLPGKKKSDEPLNALATITLDLPVTDIDLQDKQLVIVEAGQQTQVDVLNLINVRMPERLKSIKLDGNYSTLARVKDALLLVGQRSDKKMDAKLISMRPTPHVVTQLLLPLTDIHHATAQKGQFMLVGNQIHRQAVVPITYNKKFDMTQAAPVLLPGNKGGPASKSRIAITPMAAYIASDWGGVQVLQNQKTSWQYAYSHTIPRLPAAGVVVFGDRAVLGGADLKVYDIARPDHPVMVSSTETGSTVRGLVPAGNNKLLCLSRESLSLRKLDKPTEILASIKISGTALTFDESQSRAFVLSSKPKDITSIQPVAVTTTLTTEKAVEYKGNFRRAAAANGNLLLAGLNNVALYKADGSSEPIGSRNFPNFAIRDLYLAADKAIITAVDQNLKGYLLVISTDKPELTTLGSIDVPQDAVALAVSGKTAVVVGRGSEGKDVASVIDISNSIAPKVVASFPVLEAASAVAIKDQLAFVVGRGLEILTLS
jgi:hypothetical protein